MDQQVAALRQFDQPLARRRVAREDHRLAVDRIQPQAEAGRDFPRDVLDIAGRDPDQTVLEHHAGLAFPHVGLEHMHVALAVLVGGPRLDVLGEGAVGELVLDETARARRADHDGRVLPVGDPAGQHEEGEVGDMGVVQVGQEHRIDMAGIDVAADQLVRRAVAAVEHVVPAADGDQDGRVVAVRVGRGGGRAEHDDAHGLSWKTVD